MWIVPGPGESVDIGGPESGEEGIMRLSESVDSWVGAAKVCNDKLEQSREQLIVFS